MTKSYEGRQRSPRDDKRSRNLSAWVRTAAQIIQTAVVIIRYFNGC